MFHKLRALHKWIGLCASLFLILISLTGFFLAIKSKAGWIRPETQDGTEIESFESVISIDHVIQASTSQGLDGLSEPSDVDRLEYRVKDNIFKVLSKENYHEVQVDGSTGDVLSVGTRNDQFFENLHDFSLFGDLMHDWLLPAVAIGLFILGCTGVYMYFVPVFRRWKYNKEKASKSS